MAAILWALVISLLMLGCLGSLGQTAKGCMKWTQHGNNVCCESCNPGNRLVMRCGPDPKVLCTPCRPQRFTVKPLDFSCDICRQCVGAQVLLKECTATTNTKCGCKEGLTCGDIDCNFCVKKCDKGQEPAANRSCRACPEGTFNDQIHQKCKPWSTKCPNPDEKIVAKGDALSDIKCAPVIVTPVIRPKQPENGEEVLQFDSLAAIVSLIALSIIVVVIFIIFVALKTHQKTKMKKMTVTKTQIISPPSDEPKTLIAIECSFHEAQQEQGGSSESIASKDSSEQLLG